MQTTQIGASIVFLSGVVSVHPRYASGEIIFGKFFKLNFSGWEKDLFNDR